MWQQCNKNGAKTAPYNKEKEERGEKIHKEAAIRAPGTMCRPGH